RRLCVERNDKAAQILDIARLEQPFGPSPALEPDKRGQRRIRLERAPCGPGLYQGCIGHQGLTPLRAAPTASARPAAHLVMSPAPRHTTMSLGCRSAARAVASVAASAMVSAAR